MLPWLENIHGREGEEEGEGGREREEGRGERERGGQTDSAAMQR